MSAIHWLGPTGDLIDDDIYQAKRAGSHLGMDQYRAIQFLDEKPKVDVTLRIIELVEHFVDLWRARKSIYIRENSLRGGASPWAEMCEAFAELEEQRLTARDRIATAYIAKITEALKPLAQLVEQECPCNEIDVIEAAVRMLKLQAADVKEYGPFFAIIERDGNTLRCNISGDPYVFRQMGPHDNHTSHGRRVASVMLVERDRICRMTKINVQAEIGKPWQAMAVFDGDGVRAFASHMTQWFRENGGQNFISMEMMDPVDGDRFELTMQRAGAKTPAQNLIELRTLLQQIYNADRDAIQELRRAGIDQQINPRFQYAIEDLLGLPSTKPAGETP